MSKPQVSIIDKLNFPGIGDNELAAFAYSFLYFQPNYGVSFGGIGANGEDTGGVTNLKDGVSHCPASECCDQTGHGGGMSETGAVIHIVMAEHCAGEFLDDIVVLVGALGGREEGYLIFFVANEFAGNQA